MDGRMTDTKDIRDCWEYTKSRLDPLFDEMETDFRMTLGDQWTLSDKQKLRNKGKPALSINIMKKPIDLVIGHQRQNFQDLKILPIEGADEIGADVLTQVFKWIMSSQGASNYISYAFQDAAIGGIGWMAPEMNYDRDILNGDFMLQTVSPFSIYFDPAFKDISMRDCTYMLRVEWMSKTRAKALYPEHEKDISVLGQGRSSGEHMAPSDTKYMVRVVEKWTKKREKVKMAINLLTTDVEDYDERKHDGNPEYQVAELPQDRMYLTTTINEDVVIFDGENPYGINKFPFIPIFGYFVPSFDEWEWRVQGLARVMRDLQREKNKRRSQWMETVLSMPHGGWIMDKGALADKSVLSRADGTTKILEVEEGKKLQQIQPPQIPTALVQLDQQGSEDIREVGLNADLLGMMSERGAPALSIQLRQKQGITAIQTFFDNLSFAKKNLGRYMIDMIQKNWDSEKISRIIGQDVDLEMETIGSVYDVAVDEIAETPTYRQANAIVLSEMAKQGLPVPPEAIIELLDIPPSVKQRTLEMMQQQQQMQMQAQAAETPPQEVPMDQPQ